MHKPEQPFAPQYSQRERLMIVLKHSLWFVPLFIITKFWFFDWLKAMLDDPSRCDHLYVDMTKVDAFFYSLFVGLPILMAIVIFLTEGRRAIKIIRLGQSPLPGEKVFKATPYRYGAKAKLRPFILLALIIGLVVFACWGVVQANILLTELQVCNVMA